MTGDRSIIKTPQDEFSNRAQEEEEDTIPYRYYGTVIPPPGFKQEKRKKKKKKKEKPIHSINHETQLPPPRHGKTPFHRTNIPPTIPNNPVPSPKALPAKWRKSR